MQKLPQDVPHLPDSRLWTEVLDYHPTEAEVDALIARATCDELGIEFLLNGELGCVAIRLKAHAFAVVAARERLLGSAGGTRGS